MRASASTTVELKNNALTIGKEGFQYLLRRDIGDTNDTISVDETNLGPVVINDSVSVDFGADGAVQDVEAAGRQAQQTRDGERPEVGRVSQIVAQREQAYAQQYAPPPQEAPSAPPAAPTGADDTIERLQALADLKAQGVLTEEEFTAQKAKILGS